MGQTCSLRLLYIFFKSSFTSLMHVTKTLGTFSKNRLYITFSTLFYRLVLCKSRQQEASEGLLLVPDLPRSFILRSRHLYNRIQTTSELLNWAGWRIFSIREVIFPRSIKTVIYKINMDHITLNRVLWGFFHSCHNYLNGNTKV